MNLNTEEIIKTFLKVDTPTYADKPYYSINRSKNKITLYDKIIKSPSDNSADFEEDKIFNQSDENSYIYEEICLNLTKDILNEISYLFVFYGDTSSSKFNLSIGDIKEDKTNYNKYGIFLRFIDNIIKEINKKENNHIKLKISYFMLHDSDIYDLSKLRNKNLDIDSFTMEHLDQYKYTIKKEENILDNITKLDLEKMTKELNFLVKILNILFKLESNEKSKILSFSHFYFTLYLTNEKTKKNSIVNFLILNGCEYLYNGINKQFQMLVNKAKEGSNHENIIKGSKISLETQYTYETLINFIKLKFFENIKTKKLTENDLNLINCQQQPNSKLTNILINMFSNLKKLHFRIICTMTPTTGQYQSFKDSLMFLLDFNKLKNRYIKKETSKRQKNDINLYSPNNKNISEKIMKKLLDQKNDIAKKDNKIFLLENNLNDYKKEINEAKKEINKRNEKISLLENIYSQQINAIKNRFEFGGDINVLISGDVTSKEMKYVKVLKEEVENNKIKDNNIKELKLQLKEKNDVINQLKYEIELLKSNQTMINYYLSSNENQNKSSEKKQEQEEKNNLRNTIENLKKEIDVKNILIDKYRQELDNKNKILSNLPSGLTGTFIKKVKNTNKKEINESKDIENESENFISDDKIFENEIKKIKKESNENIKNIKNNYENLIEQKNENIKKIEYECSKIQTERNNDIIKYTNEIARMNKLLMRLLSNYKRIFSSNLTPRINIMNYSTKIDEFDKILTGINQEITYDKFPLLYEHLIKTKQLNINQPYLYSNMKKVYTPILKDLEEKNEIKDIDRAKSQKYELMSKESLIEYILKIKEKNSVIKNKENVLDDLKIKEENEENRDNIINELKNRLNRLNIQLEEQIKKNNKNEVIIGAQNRKINRLQKESLILNHNLRNKKQNSTQLTHRSTFYNTTAIDFNSNISENITTNKNNFNKFIKKSNSCVQMNKIKNRRPISHKIKKFSEINPDKNYTSYKVLSNEFSSKLREFQIERENKLINFTQNKK